MNKTKTILIAIIICLIGAGAASASYMTYKIKETTTLDMDIEISSRGGLVGDPGIHFGRITPGGYSTKKITINNTYNHNLEIVAKFSGELGKWVSIEGAEEALTPGETRTVELIAAPPRTTPHGNYTGQVKILQKRV